jgi:hypothetical protein
VACPSLSGPTGDYRTTPRSGFIAQLIWAVPERLYYKADGDRLVYTRDGTGFVIRRELEVRNCLVGMLDLREIDRRALGAGAERRGAIFMDLVDYWLRMDLRQQLRFIDRYHGTKNQ